MSVEITNESAELKEVIGWQGTILPIQLNAEPYRRLGYPGTELNLVGDLAPNSSIFCVYLLEDGEDLKVALDWWNQLKYTYITVSIPYEYGLEYDRVLVLDIQTAIKTGRGGYAGVQYQTRIEIQMVLQDQSGYELSGD